MTKERIVHFKCGASAPESEVTIRTYSETSFREVSYRKCPTHGWSCRVEGYSVFCRVCGEPFRVASSEARRTMCDRCEPAEIKTQRRKNREKHARAKAMHARAKAIQENKPRTGWSTHCRKCRHRLNSYNQAEGLCERCKPIRFDLPAADRAPEESVYRMILPHGGA